jgi:Rrf2 family protein
MLSQTSEYALRAVLFIAAQPDDSPSTVDEISAGVGVPVSYLSKTLQLLVKEGILCSSRGRNGGFQLAVPSASLPLERIIAVFDRHPATRHCVLGRSRCNDATPCAAHHAWKPNSDRIAEFFARTTVADLHSPLEALAPLPVL